MGRLGTPEVWRFDDSTATCTFWNRCDDGHSQKIDRSRFFPLITPDDVSAQVLRAAEMGTARWQAGLAQWIQGLIRPRPDGGVEI